MATIQTVNNGDSGFAARTKINNNDANINAALEAAESLLTTDNANLDDFQKITDAIEAIQSTLSVNDAAYNTLQKIVDKLKAAETKLATIATGAEVNVQADWDETNNTSDAFIQNKPTFGDISDKNVGNQVGEIQENGAILGNTETVETDGTGKFITAAKNTAYNANFGTGNTDVARGDASYLKADTYTKAEADALLATKEATANKGVANGYASLDGNAQVPLSQIPANAKISQVVADIAARDAIASADRFEGLRVHVLNASADSTVTSGSAGYILKSGLTNTDWEKTYESESLDIDLSVYFNKTTDTTDDITEGTAKFTTQANIDKLAGIEANATADQTAAEIKTAYESNADTNAFTDAEKTKLAGIDSGATANSPDADLLNRSNHTGEQAISTVTGLQAALDTKLSKASNLSDVNNQQIALNNVTNVSGATNEQVLTKDTATGNAIFKSIPSLQALLPTGTVVMSIASSLSGALKFDGVSSYSKTTYSTLYALISSLVGTTFDVDANNFFLPDPADRVLGIAGSGKTLFSSLGADTISLLEANIPAHDHFQYTDDIVGNVGDIDSTTSPARERSVGGIAYKNYQIEQGTGEPTLGLTSSVGSGTAFSIEQKTFIAGQNLFIYY